MEVTFQLRRVEAVGCTCLNQAASRYAGVGQAVTDEVAFENSRALTAALQNAPAVREEIVRRATELVADVNYPPPETIRMISLLLASQLDSDGELF